MRSLVDGDLLGLGERLGLAGEDVDELGRSMSRSA